MNVVILNDYSFVNGGAAKIAITNAIALAKKNIKTYLFSAVGPIPSELINQENLKVICLNQYDILTDPNRLRAAIHGIWNVEAAKSLAKLLADFSPSNTIIHVHACSKALSTSCIRVAIDMGFKVIYHIHDYALACPNLGFYNYQLRKNCLLTPLSRPCLLTNCDSRSYYHKVWRCLRQYVQQNYGLLPKGIDSFIAISQYSYNILKNYLDSDKVYLVDNPIDICLEGARVNAEKNSKYIFIGRLSSEKNPDLLAKIGRKLNLDTLFIGDGPNKKEIKDIYTSATVTGWKTALEIEEYIKQARILIFPSLWNEVQPLVPLEVMSKGIPCIVSNTCAAKDYIRDGYNGFVFDVNNIKDLEDKITLTFKHDIVKKLSQNAYEYFREEARDIETYINKMIGIYQSTLSKARK